MKYGQKGFSLFEVTIAITLFGVFIGAFYANRGSNLRDSDRMREETILQLLCEEKINKILIAPPAFGESLTLMAQTETFEDPGYENYEAVIEWRKVTIPDLSALMNNSEEDETKSEDNSSLQRKVYEQLKNNVEKMLWQVQVTVKNKETQSQYALATWINDEKAKIKLQF